MIANGKLRMATSRRDTYNYIYSEELTGMIVKI